MLGPICQLRLYDSLNWLCYIGTWHTVGGQQGDLSPLKTQLPWTGHHPAPILNLGKKQQLPTQGKPITLLGY